MASGTMAQYSNNPWDMGLTGGLLPGNGEYESVRVCDVFTISPN